VWLPTFVLVSCVPSMYHYQVKRRIYLRGVHATAKNRIQLKKEGKSLEIKKVCSLKKESKIFFHFLRVQSLYVVELESSLPISCTANAP